MELVLVGVGGVLGANARFLLGGWIQQRRGGTFPLHTSLINVSGSFLIGIVAGLLQRVAADPAWRLLLVVGFLGGYTTFSTYTYELATLVEGEAWTSIAWYAVGQNVLALVCAAAGLWLAARGAG